jgi:hypothetical protein
MTNEINPLYERAKFFKEKNLPVHITKKNSWFNNGFIIDLEYDFIILIDEKEGEIPIFFKEILEISKREVKK